MREVSISNKISRKKKIGYIPVIFIIFLTAIQVSPLITAAYIMKQPDPVYYSMKRNELLNCSKTQMQTFGIPWVAACAREGTFIYDDASLTGRGFQAAYLQRFAVVDKTGDKLKLQELDKAKPAMGWTAMKNLIYLPCALKDERTSVYQKVIFTHIEGQWEPGEIGDITFYKSPDSYQPGNILENRPHGTLRIAYVYAWENSDYEDSQWVLIGNYPSIESVSKDGNAFKKNIYGWCKTARLFPWNSRMALIPNKDKNANAYIFRDGPGLTNFYSTASAIAIPDPDDLLTSNSYKMWQDSNWPFFLEGKLNNSNLDYVRLVCQVDARYANASGIPIETLRKELDYLKTRGQHLDVVFLLDATKGMSQYINAVASIVTGVMERLKDNNGINREHLRFGAAVYRNYVDGYQKFEIEPLTNNLASIENKLNYWAKHTYNNQMDPGEATWPDALLYGIRQTIGLSGYGTHNSRFLIVIGDAGNHSRGLDYYTKEKIGKLLAENRISYIMVTVNYPASGGDRERDAMELFRINADNIQNNYFNYFDDEGIKYKSTFSEKDMKKLLLFDMDRVNDPSILQYRLKEFSGRISNSVDAILENYQRLIEGEKIAVTTKGIINDSVKPFSSSTDGMYINPLVFENLKVRFGKDFPRVLDELRQKRAYIMKFGYAVEKDPRTKINQFKNVYLFRKSEINKINYNLDTTRALLTPRKVNALWRDLIERVYGEEYDPRRTFNQYTQMYDGITYKELSILFDKTQGEIDNLNINEFDIIVDKISVVKGKLEDILNDKANERFFGPLDDPYIWLYEEELP